MNIKPGDIFMWVDDVHFDYVPEHTSVYCDPESNTKRARCDGICLCIAIKDDIAYWMCNHVLFQSRARNTDNQLYLQGRYPYGSSARYLYVVTDKVR